MRPAGATRLWAGLDLKSHGCDVATILQSEFSGQVWIDHAIGGDVLYAVVDDAGLYIPDYVCDAYGPSRSIIVFLFDRRVPTELDFGCRDIYETEGPYVAACPVRLIRIASPFRPGRGAFGPQWRIACMTGRQHL